VNPKHHPKESKLNEVLKEEVTTEQAQTGTALVKVETALEEYKDFVDGLNEMLKLRGIAYNLTTVAGNDTARRDRAKLKATRVAIEKRCADKKRELKASVATKVEKLEGEAARFVGIVTDLFTPIDEMIEADQARREREKAEHEAAEAERTEGHRARITDISDVALRAVGLPSAEIQKKIDLVTRVEITGAFEEFEAAAGNVKFETLLRLKELYGNAVLSEQQAEEARRNAERLAQLERENAERIARETQERTEREAREAEARQAEQRAADARHIQSNTANDLVDEIRRIQRRGMTASAVGMLELIALVTAVSIGTELGEYAAGAQQAKDAALTDLNEMHQQVMAREITARREREEQAARQKQLDEQAAELQRKQAAIEQQERALAAAAEPKPEPEPGPATVEQVVNALKLETPFTGVNIVEVHRQPEPAAESALDTTDSTAPRGAQPSDEPQHPPTYSHAEEGSDRLLACVVRVMKAAKLSSAARTSGTWVVPGKEMKALKEALRAMPLPSPGAYYAEDGTLMNADGTRSIFDDVDE
jgi:hypothetical protein